VDSGSKPAPGKQFSKPYLEKKIIEKRAGRVSQAVKAPI
jgi:hypothetical protein